MWNHGFRDNHEAWWNIDGLHDDLELGWVHVVQTFQARIDENNRVVWHA